MARKEQITITLDPELVAKLRDIADRKKKSLSSVIEAFLLASDAISQKNDIHRVLELVEEIKGQLAQRSEEASPTLSADDPTPARLPRVK